jgi:hypothetical protein
LRLEGLPRDVVQQVPCEVVALRSRRVRLDGDFEPDGARERRARDVVPHVGVVAPVGGGGGGVVQLSLLLLLMLLLLLLLLLMLLMLLLLLLLLMLLLLMMLLHLRTQLVEGPLRRMRGGGGGVPLKGLEREGVHPGQRARAPPAAASAATSAAAASAASAFAAFRFCRSRRNPRSQHVSLAARP